MRCTRELGILSGILTDKEAVRMSTNTNFGSGRIEVNIPELRKMKSSAEKLITEIETRASTTLSQARSAANWASGKYGTDVSSQTSAVLSQCNTLSNSSSAALDELRRLDRRLGDVITGYQNLERNLASTSSDVILM